jgi:hypothetical protein
MIGCGALIGVAEDPGRYENGGPLLESEHGYSSVTMRRSCARTRGIDISMRIVGLDVSVADGGDENVTLTMNPLLEEVS